MNTITIEVPKDIAQKHKKKSLTRKKLLEIVEEYLRTDVDITPKMELSKFYDTLKKN